MKTSEEAARPRNSGRTQLIKDSVEKMKDGEKDDKLWQKAMDRVPDDTVALDQASLHLKGGNEERHIYEGPQNMMISLYSVAK